jgi:hypothetical protein
MISSTVRAEELLEFEEFDDEFASGLPDSIGALTVAQPETSTPAVSEAANKNECEILFSSFNSTTFKPPQLMNRRNHRKSRA